VRTGCRLAATGLIAIRCRSLAYCCSSHSAARCQRTATRTTRSGRSTAGSSTAAGDDGPAIRLGLLSRTARHSSTHGPAAVTIHTDDAAVGASSPSDSRGTAALPAPVPSTQAWPDVHRHQLFEPFQLCC